ncbi:PPE family protein [Mycobacterium avium]|uniref:PPE family protein n=2 Tax=Mycobacterium avium TaxID=1764 RepID=UPI000A01A038|nr:PPE family protein [Mycobacterium avium]
MLDYGALPPEINSTRMDAGPGSAPLIAAAAAWDVLANALETAARGYSAVITRLHGESWSGSASVAMAGAAAPYFAWLAEAGTQAEEAAGQARAAAAAYEAAFGATVPPAVVTANRALFAQLVASNILGQNTAAIGEAEGAYAEMWAQDAAAMYGYAAASSGATRLRPFDEPPRTTNADGPGAQAAAVARSATGSAANQSHASLSRAMSTVPHQLQTLSGAGSSGSSSSSSGSSALSAVDNFNTLTAPVNLGDGISRTVTSGGTSGTGLFRSNLQSAGEAFKAVPGAAAAAGTSTAAVVPGPAVAGAGTATTVGRLSVPQTWAATNPAAGTVAEPLWLSDAELDGGPSWHEGPAAGMWNGAPAAGASSSLLSRPSVNNVLRVAPRQFKMPRPSAGG